jgi:hypothetical protein
MPVRCPICETDNLDDAAECATCAWTLVVDADMVDDVPLLEGLEETLHDPFESMAPPEPPLAGLEQTLLAGHDLPVEDEVVPDVERTQIEVDPNATSAWSGGVPLDEDRALDTDPRTPAPQDTGTCPWCGAPAGGAVCDACGRRRFKYTASPTATSPAQTAGGPQENVTCPACFGRVQPGPRCSECGLPFGVPAL